MHERLTPESSQLSDQPMTKEVAASQIATTTRAAGGQPTLNWEAIQEEVATSFPNIAPFLEAGRLVGVEGGLVTIGFGKQATVARARLEKEDNLLALAKLCERQSGHPMRVRIVELTEADLPGPTMAQARAAKEQDQRLVLFERAQANPMVKQALEIFGAELAEVRTVAQKEASE
jgi:DNA polymerase-3 subunit gamma/tau